MRREVVGGQRQDGRIRSAGSSTVSGLFSSYQASGNWLRRLNERSPLNRRSSVADHLLAVLLAVQRGVLDREQHVGDACGSRTGSPPSAAPARQTVSTPMPSNGSSSPVSGSSSNSPVALIGEVNAIDSGSRRRVTVSKGPRATTVRDTPDADSVARTPRTGGTSAMSDTRDPLDQPQVVAGEVAVEQLLRGGERQHAGLAELLQLERRRSGTAGTSGSGAACAGRCRRRTGRGW